MNSFKRCLSILLFFFTIIKHIQNNSPTPFDYEKILDKNYKSNLEFIFDPEVDYDMHISENDPIRKKLSQI